MLNADSTFKVPDHVIMRVVGDDAVLLDMEAGKYFGLNDVGAEIWNLLEAGSTLSEIQNAIEAKFDVDNPTLMLDLAKLLENLLEAKLICNAYM